MLNNPDFKGQYLWIFFIFGMLVWGLGDVYSSYQGLPIYYCRGYGSSKICSEVSWWLGYVVTIVAFCLLWTTLRVVLKRCRQRIFAEPQRKKIIQREFVLSLLIPVFVSTSFFCFIIFIALIIKR